MVSLSSCVQTDEVYTGGVQEIGFKSAVTRAIINETTFDGNIAVSSVWNNPADAAGFVSYFDNITFAKNTAGYWAANPAKYWPTSGDMQFLALHPAIEATAAYNADGTFETLTTGLIKNATTQDDVLFSDLLPCECAPAAVQALKFHHAMTLLQVNFQTSLTTEEVKIVSATVADVVLGGDLTVTAAKPSTAAWSNPSTAIDHTFAKVTTAALTTTKNTDATPLLVVPAAAQTEMTIVYTLNGHQMTKVVPLAAYGAWEAGNKYIYNFSIGANEIQFTCEVDKWTDVTVGGGNIAI
jgi:hypothetical protein